jgi:multiple sugar transport system permease protein
MTTFHPNLSRFQGLRLGRSGRERLWFYVFIAPWLIGFILLTITPMVWGFSLSLFNYDGLNWDFMKFVGAQNYVRAFSNPLTWQTLRTTFILALINVPVSVLMMLGLALLVNQDVPGKGLFRTLFYLPSFLPVVAGIYAWRAMLDKNFGLLNGLISQFMPDTAINWLGNDQYVIYAILTLVWWGGVGGGMVILLGGLQNVPRELKEAAVVDGANAWDVFRHITLPMLSPTLFFQTTVSLIGSMQIMIQPLFLARSSGGVGAFNSVPPRSVNTFLVNVFRMVFGAQPYFSQALALLWIFFIIVIAITLVYMFAAQKFVYYEVEQR